MGAPTDADRRAVADLLGREPDGEFDVVVRHADGGPVVIRNAPVLPSGRPMPTRFWLVGEPERTWVGRLEAAGGVDRAEAEVDAEVLAAAHDLHAAERSRALPPGHDGPRPSGGVAGTRRGVKCLHAHYAWWLAGGADPVGEWVADHLDEVGGGRPGAGGPVVRPVGPAAPDPPAEVGRAAGSTADRSVAGERVAEQAAGDELPAVERRVDAVADRPAGDRPAAPRPTGGGGSW
ncbi:MAG: DUF501 domain-containing protein [Acidimicrobiales bacterium]|nr:DUF501 domain-containing protein [Acidimicrobiales bacterium]